jgi:hypothetical protein
MNGCIGVIQAIKNNREEPIKKKKNRFGLSLHEAPTGTAETRGNNKNTRSALAGVRKSKYVTVVRCQSEIHML